MDKAAALHRQAVQCLQQRQYDRGIELLKEAAKAAPQIASIHSDLGTACWQAGRPAEAEKHFKTALKQAPQNPQTLNNYGTFLMYQGNLGEAEKYLKQALALQPGHPEILNNLGLVYRKTGDLPAAEHHFFEAAKAAATWPNAHFNLGKIFLDTGRLMEAEQAFRHTVKVSPRHAPAWTALGQTLGRMKKTEEALSAFQSATQADPSYESGWVDYVSTLEFTGQIDQAKTALATAQKRFPASLSLTLAAAKLARREKDTDRAVTLLEDLLGKVNPEAPATAAVYFELAQLYDRQNLTDKAFACMEKANRLQGTAPENAGIDKNAIPAMIATYQTAVTKQWYESWSPAPAMDKALPRPVFLVGFPRSGTTLLDQILSSHPDIQVAEESPVIEQIRSLLAKEGAYPENLATLPAERIAAIRKDFFALHEAYGSKAEAPLFVDKMPLNILHAGLIHRLFPEARFILALRHPCDCVLSCFMQFFTLNEAMIHYSALNDAATLYRQSFALWDHYRAALPLAVHTVKYEDVVGNFQPTIAGLLEFLEVPWTDVVLDYDKTAREKGAINTPSYNQVTEKLYTRARGRWERYRDHMTPVMDTLAPCIKAHGYDPVD
ncbi:MAG: sulfotransferase [Rhodospirillales bacterium]|nr:sulfotransferase [Rhodospirillales bacterium]